MVDEVGIEREGSLELGEGVVVLALPEQDLSKLGASLRQAGVEVHSRLRQFKGVIKRSGTEMIAIEWFEISVDVGLGQHRARKADRSPGIDQADAVPHRATLWCVC